MTFIYSKYTNNIETKTKQQKKSLINMAELQEIELYIKDEKEDGVFAISLVESPAIEENFIALSKDGVELKVVDEERRIVVGYALIPEKRIYRKMKGKEFNIYFSKETISKTQELYMKNLNANNVTSEHEKPVTNCTVIESWITESTKHDKVALYGIKPIEGAWAVMMKINNDDEWQAVKEGEYKGFSIEGIYQGFEALEMAQETKPTDEDILEAIIKVINEGK